MNCKSPDSDCHANPSHNKLLVRLAMLIAAVAMSTAVSDAATVILNAAKDNTLYQPGTSAGTTSTNSNGVGEHLFAGRTDDGLIRRGVIAFDLTNSVPVGSVVTAVTLSLYCSRTKDASEPVTLHRVLANWGEGTSNAQQEEGKGIQATTNDVTWFHRFFPGTLWTVTGGVFTATASATTTVAREGFFSWSSTGLVADVQAWVNNPGTNFGWLIKGGEGATKTAKRFDTREATTINQRPMLIVDFTPPSPLGACVLTNGTCQQFTSNQCSILGGTFLGAGSNCPPATGACCLPNGMCTNLTAAQCAALSGTYQGDNTPCTTNLCPVILTPFVDALPVPTPFPPTTGTIGGAATYVVPMNEVQQKLHRDLPLTTVWAYGNATPGPLIEASADQPVTVVWTNNLRDSMGQLRTNHYLPVDLCPHGPDTAGATPRTVVHLHGGKVPPKDDGYPEDTFLPGQARTNFYPNSQPPGTLWFHDHAIGITRLNVYMGLAGLYTVRDAFETALNLPAGDNEVPLVIQDRKFRADGSLVYPIMWDEHFFGDTLLVNGKVWPYFVVKQGKYRFRVVNGSTSRTYSLGLSSGATFHQIGTEGGMLTAPVPLNLLTLMPGERADVVMDFTSYSNGTQLILTNGAPTQYPGSPGIGVIPQVMKFIVTNLAGHTPALPATLRPIETLFESNAVIHRDFTLRKTADPCTGSKWLINDLLWHDITEFPVLGTTEVWNFINRSGVSHPMHLHLVLMQVLDRQAFIVSNNVVVPTGPRVPPPAGEAGWKDTVRCDPGEITRVITRFEGFTGRYPYHCHILEHEDHEMMRQFEVIPPPEFTSINRAGDDIVLGFNTITNLTHAVSRRDDYQAGMWATLFSNLLGSGSDMYVTNTGAASQPQRYYRLELTPTNQPP